MVLKVLIETNFDISFSKYVPIMNLANGINQNMQLWDSENP